MRQLRVQALESAAFGPYGWVLGVPFPSGNPLAAFRSDDSDFWQAHLFDCGEGGQPEFLWVAYRDGASPVGVLEKHLLTQQALIPLTGDVIQFVACSGADGGPDLATLAAFHVTQGRGLCMRPGCWHSTRIVNDEVVCAMLTRQSTTLDLVQQLKHGALGIESVLSTIEPCTWLPLERT